MTGGALDLVRMEQGKVTRGHETTPSSVSRPHILVPEFRWPETPKRESAASHRDRAFIGLRVVGLAERSKYAGLLPFPFLLPLGKVSDLGHHSGPVQLRTRPCQLSSLNHVRLIRQQTSTQGHKLDLSLFSNNQVHAAQLKITTKCFQFLFLFST